MEIILLQMHGKMHVKKFLKNVWKNPLTMACNTLLARGGGEPPHHHHYYEFWGLALGFWGLDTNAKLGLPTLKV